jgi:hypothetical protein
LVILIPAFDNLFDAEHKLLLHVQFGQTEDVFHVLSLHSLEHFSSNFFGPGNFDKGPKAYFSEPLSQSLIGPLLDILYVPFKGEEKVIPTGYFNYLLVGQGVKWSSSDFSLHLI